MCAHWVLDSRLHHARQTVLSCILNPSHGILKSPAFKKWRLTHRFSVPCSFRDLCIDFYSPHCAGGFELAATWQSQFPSGVRNNEGLLKNPLSPRLPSCGTKQRIQKLQIPDSVWWRQTGRLCFWVQDRSLASVAGVPLLKCPSLSCWFGHDLHMSVIHPFVQFRISGGLYYLRLLANATKTG